MVDTGADAETIAKAHGFEAMDVADLEPRSSTRSSPPTPTTGTTYVGGDDKRRKKVPGFFIGKVMKATQGQADGKAVTALLEQRRAGRLTPTRTRTRRTRHERER